MSNLFALRNDGGGMYHQDGGIKYFDNKQDAKVKRRELNPKDEEGTEVLQWMVTRGPDHDLGMMKSGYTAPGQRSAKKKAV